ncbi:phage tail assembly protein T [Pedomonas sp. V897]|uniref:phage tail assembly protein T n=1 Tax=Pedomonas sp. V897 TaxID=3446482 RepID=UPI003EDEFF7A
MGRTPRELGRLLTSEELTEFMALDLVEPFGQRRMDDCFRLLAALIYNSNLAGGAKVLMPGDFLKVWEPPVERDLKAEAEAIYQYFQKRVRRQS